MVPPHWFLTADLAVVTPRPQEAQNGENSVSNMFFVALFVSPHCRHYGYHGGHSQPVTKGAAQRPALSSAPPPRASDSGGHTHREQPILLRSEGDR